MVKGLRRRSRQEVELLPLGPTLVTVHGTAKASHPRGPQRAYTLLFLHGQSWPWQLEAQDTGRRTTRGIAWWAWESDPWVPVLALPLPGWVILGMLFTFLLNLKFSHL